MTSSNIEANSSTTDGDIVVRINISDQAVEIFLWVVIVGLCQAIDIFGVITNVINIMCFVSQGFKEPVNISLFGLSISDLGCLLTQICINACFTLHIAVPTLPLDPVDVGYLTGATPHFAFTRINVWITAIITLERCLCITVPLKVRSIVTPKRLGIVIICVYALFLFSAAPIYVVNRLGMKFDATKNRTLLGRLVTPEKNIVEMITFIVNSFFLPFIAFIIIIICTVILAVHLQRRTKWRKSAAQPDLSTREQKMAKMVVTISAVFVFCFVPVSVNMLAVAFEPELNVGGKYVNITKVSGNLGFLLESVNSSANIFIYYHMSSKYRVTLRSILLGYIDKIIHKN